MAFKIETVEEYVARNYESKAAFARSLGVTRQQVNRWLSDKFIVLDGKLYSLRLNFDTGER